MNGSEYLASDTNPVSVSVFEKATSAAYPDRAGTFSQVNQRFGQCLGREVCLLDMNRACHTEFFGPTARPILSMPDVARPLVAAAPAIMLALVHEPPSASRTSAEMRLGAAATSGRATSRPKPYKLIS